MLLSFSHKFVFVRARKVAGTSVEKVLSCLCSGDDIVPPMIVVDERTRQRLGGFSGNYGRSRLVEKQYAKMVCDLPLEQLAKLAPPSSRYSPHMSLAEIASVSGQSLEDFRLIAVERNPYGKVISFLHMRQHFDAYQAGIAMPRRVRDLGSELDSMIKKGGIPALKSLALYGGRRPHLLRYEYLETDLAELAASLGVKLPALPHAKRGALSNDIDPLSLFSRSQIDWINDYFAEEFAAFGYVGV